jgi:putative ABC transport system ATP-binding protein
MMITKRSLMSWILKNCRLLQMGLLLLIGVAIVLRVFPLEMQRRIVNTAIHSRNEHLLFLYGGLYLGAVVLSGIFKYAINVIQTYIGQKILLIMRRELYAHILSLPLEFFRRTPPGTVLTSLTSELNAIGHFIGGALTLPVTSILTLLTFAGYMIYLDPLLALVSLSIYPIEIMIIPMLQKRYNQLNSRRIDVTRNLSNTISESVSGIHEIQGNAAYYIELGKFDTLIQKMFTIRNRMFAYKYGTKFVNNLFQNLGPFFLFMIGGYFAIRGQFSLGALVAFLSAYEKVYDPWKELMGYYQQLHEVRVKYRRVMEYFDELSQFAWHPLDRDAYQLQGNLSVRDMGYRLDSGAQLLEHISFDLELGEQVALVGASGSGKSSLAMILGQLYLYNQGHVMLDGRELKQFTKMDISCNIGFVAQHPFIFNGTIRENLLYGCRARQLLFSAGKETGEPFDHSSEPDISQLLQMVHDVGLTDDIVAFGLNSVLSTNRHQTLKNQIVEMRTMLQDKLDTQLSRWVEVYDIDVFLNYANIYTNLLFGDIQQEAFRLDNLLYNKDFLKFLTRMKLKQPLLELGFHIVRQTVTLLKDFENNPLFFENTPIEAGQLEFYATLVERFDATFFNMPDKKTTARILEPALKFVPARHKIAGIPESLKEMIVAARHEFFKTFIGIEDWESACLNGQKGEGKPIFRNITKDDFTLYCPMQYLASRSLLDNIVFGTLKREQNRGMITIERMVVDLLREEGLLEDVMNAGLDFQVGSKGDRLSGGQRQKIAIARVLLKDPTILIMDEATASLDNTSQARIQRLVDNIYRGRKTSIAVIHRLDLLPAYDKIMVLQSGQLMESGTYDELMRKKGIFYELVQGNG